MFNKGEKWKILHFQSTVTLECFSPMKTLYKHCCRLCPAERWSAGKASLCMKQLLSVVPRNVSQIWKEEKKFMRSTVNFFFFLIKKKFKIGDTIPFGILCIYNSEFEFSIKKRNYSHVPYLIHNALHSGSERNYLCT